MDNRERIDRSDRQDLPVPKRWAKDPASLKPWTLKYFDSKIGPINGLDEFPRPSGPRRPTRMVAGTKQVVSLLREGCSAHAILARLKMRPARLREIVASKGFQRMVELEWMAMRSGMLLRLGRNVSEAAGLLTMVGEFGEPESARKAALNVLQLAMQPPTQLPARTPDVSQDRIYRILQRMTAERTTHDKLVLENARDVQKRGRPRRKDDNV